jgi:hypothetical protein
MISVHHGTARLVGDDRLQPAHLRPEQRIVEPALKFVDVELGRHDVVVAGEDDLRSRG